MFRFSALQKQAGPALVALSYVFACSFTRSPEIKSATVLAAAMATVLCCNP